MLFNPLGYAFENYDAIGKYRTMDQGKPVNAADSYTLDGRAQELQERRRAVAPAGGGQGDARLLRPEHDELLARSGAGQQLRTATVDYYARRVSRRDDAPRPGARPRDERRVPQPPSVSRKETP